MTIQPIGPCAAALTLTAADLSLRGLSCAALTSAQALRLVRDALSSAGLVLPGPLELDAYPDGGGLLLLARSLPRQSTRPLPVRSCRRGRIKRHNT